MAQALVRLDRRPDEGALRKEYLAFVQLCWPLLTLRAAHELRAPAENIKVR